ncbi:MAG: hypothetical protein B7Z81_03495 [Acidocella sp. 20-61-6]|nr:MAG: hypothetical protein B7Z81_03495 [Acidocella sp. 20-61-6]
MNLSGRVSALLRHYGLAIGLGVAVLCVGLAGLGFLIAGYYVWLSSHFAVAPAAVMTGGTLFALAVLIAVIGSGVIKRMKKPEGNLFGDAASTLGLGMRLASMLIRRDPKRALILAAISGALAEFLLSDEDRR